MVSWISDYSLYFSRPPPKCSGSVPGAAMATPRHLSTRLHPLKINKDLHLRGSPLIVKPEVIDTAHYKKLSSTV